MVAQIRVTFSKSLPTVRDIFLKLRWRRTAMPVRIDRPVSQKKKPFCCAWPKVVPLALMFGLGIALPCRAQTADADLQQAYAAAQSMLNNLPGGWMSGETPLPASVQAAAPNSQSETAQQTVLVAQEWSLVQQWIVNYLNEHEWEGDIDLTPALHRLNYEFSQAALEYVELDKKTYVVGAPYGMGSVYIAHQVDGKFQIVWNTPASVDLSGANRKKLAAGVTSYLAPWTAQQEVEDSAPNSVWGLGKLPDTASGMHRFYFNTVYRQEAGATDTSQLSIWQWDGKIASSQMLIEHRDNESTPAIYFAGRILHVPTRTNFTMLLEYNSGVGNAVDQRIFVGPESVRYVGNAELMPELELIDTIFVKTSSHQKVEALASNDVISVVRPLVLQTPLWLEDVSVQHEAAKSLLCVTLQLNPSGDDKTLKFTLINRNGNYFAASANDLGSTGCGQNLQSN